jgi:hypothetical protein
MGGYEDNGPPAEDDGSGDDDQKVTDIKDDATGEESSGSDGLFGSLSGASSQQITLGVLAVVGVLVGIVYYFMTARNDDQEEYEE